MENLCKAAKRAVFDYSKVASSSGSHPAHQGLESMTPLMCKLFDTLVKLILCYGCETWGVLGCKSAVAELERVQIGLLKSCSESRPTPVPCMSFQTCLTGTL